MKSEVIRIIVIMQLSTLNIIGVLLNQVVQTVDRHIRMNYESSQEVILISTNIMIVSITIALMNPWLRYVILFESLTHLNKFQQSNYFCLIFVRFKYSPKKQYRLNTVNNNISSINNKFQGWVEPLQNKPQRFQSMKETPSVTQLNKPIEDYKNTNYKINVKKFK